MQPMGARRRSHTCPPLRPFDIYAVSTAKQDLALSIRALDLEFSKRRHPEASSIIVPLRHENWVYEVSPQGEPYLLWKGRGRCRSLDSWCRPLTSSAYLRETFDLPCSFISEARGSGDSSEFSEDGCFVAYREVVSHRQHALASPQGP